MSCRFIETAVKMFTGHAIWKPVSCEMWPVKLRRAMNVFVNVQCECKPSVLPNKAELDPRLRNLWRTRHQNVSPRIWVVMLLFSGERMDGLFKGAAEQLVARSPF